MILVRKIASGLFSWIKGLRDGRGEKLCGVNGCELVDPRVEFSSSDADGLINDTALAPGMELRREELFQWENVADRRAWESLHKAAEFERWAERARSCGREDLALLYEIKAEEWFSVYKESEIEII